MSGAAALPLCGYTSSWRLACCCAACCERSNASHLPVRSAIAAALFAKPKVPTPSLAQTLGHRTAPHIIHYRHWLHLPIQALQCYVKKSVSYRASYRFLQLSLFWRSLLVC
eukprot:6199064-Pleurochrysis_carterae.AAC.3